MSQTGTLNKSEWLHKIGEFIKFKDVRIYFRVKERFRVSTIDKLQLDQFPEFFQELQDEYEGKTKQPALNLWQTS